MHPLNSKVRFIFLFSCVWLAFNLDGAIATTPSDDDYSLDLLCELPMLGHSGYTTEDGMILYWNLCPKNGVKVQDLNLEHCKG